MADALIFTTTTIRVPYISQQNKAQVTTSRCIETGASASGIKGFIEILIDSALLHSIYLKCYLSSYDRPRFHTGSRESELNSPAARADAPLGAYDRSTL